GLQYRELLAEVRLNHALHLMQSTPWSTLNLAQMCGYQSEERFSQRFKNKFGITPKEYMKTVTG
ncbi:helix-turn-helix domain-containing protein, partial [Vibrio sinaloensis]